MITATLAWLRDEPATALDALVEPLNDEERADFLRLPHPSRQRSFLLSRAVLRSVLASEASLVHTPIRFARAPSGRLLLAEPAGWHISLSHGHDHIAVMLASAPCGIDIERPRPVAFRRVAERYFAPREQAHLTALPPDLALRDFFRFWTLKEAAAKALGQGLAHNLARLAFSLDATPPAPSGAPAQSSSPSSSSSPAAADESLGLHVWQAHAGDAWLSAAVATQDDVEWDCREIGLLSLLRKKTD